MRNGRALKPGGSNRTPFTRRMWQAWLRRLNGPEGADPQYRYLSRGIQEFREMLAGKEPQE